MENNKLLDRFDEAASKSKPPFSLISSVELTSKPRPNDWLIKGLIERGNLLLVFGRPENGKSLLALDMAFCVATGIDFFGRKVKQGSVIYLAGEGHAGLARRLKVLELKYGIKAPHLYLSKMPADLISPEGAKDVRDALDDVCSDATLVIIDTLHRNFGSGDENSSKDFGIFCHNLDVHIKKQGEAVMVVHHSGHAEAQRSRGSSSIKGAMDVEYCVIKDESSIKVSCTKVKDFEKPEPFHLSIVQRETEWLSEEGEPITSVFLEHAEQSESLSSSREKALNPKNVKVLDCLKAALSKHGISPPTEVVHYLSEINEEGVDKVVHKNHWKTETLPHLDVNSDKQNSREQAFCRARKVLLESGKVRMYNDHFWLPYDPIQSSIEAMSKKKEVTII
jgi:hypothetical protein